MKALAEGVLRVLQGSVAAADYPPAPRTRGEP